MFVSCYVMTGWRVAYLIFERVEVEGVELGQGIELVLLELDRLLVRKIAHVLVDRDVNRQHDEDEGILPALHFDLRLYVALPPHSAEEVEENHN